jgi:peroxiredoxin
MKYLQILLIAILLCFSAIAQDTAQKPKSWAPPDYNKFYKGKNYAPFNLSTLDGQNLTSETSKGKVTLFHFWFESCPGCRAEFPEVNELYDSLKNDKNCQFVAVTFDDISTLPEFVQQNNLRFPIATVNSRDSIHLLNYGMASPSMIILDKEGKIAHMGIQSITKNKEVGRYDISIAKVLAIIRGLE